MTDPQAIALSASSPVSHDPGVHDREADVDGTRWALVEYSPGAGREEWCDTPHSGYVLSGSISYAFDDGRPPLVVGAGEAFLLPPAPRHRGTNHGDEPVRLFIIDALPGS
jgi:quercetin dioxygenase-like cupin family protein